MRNCALSVKFRDCSIGRLGIDHSASSRRIMRGIVICVGLQLSLTILIPGQEWSMSMGMVGLFLIGAASTQHLGRRASPADPFATTTVTGIFILWAMMWLALTYEINFRDSEQSISFILSFSRQILLILFLVPRGLNYGKRWSIILDVILGLVLSGVLTVTLWPEAFSAHIFPPDTFQFCLGHGIYGLLAVSSYFVQRQSPPIFLKAFAITQGIYSLTSILSVGFGAIFKWPHNSIWWVYGDIALIVYPLIAISDVRRGVPQTTTMNPNLAPNYVIPFMMAVVVLSLAFGFAQRQLILAAIIGVASLVIYSCRVAYVTRQFHQAQDSMIIAGRKQVETTIDMMHEIRSPLASVILNASALARAEDVPTKLKPQVDSIAGRCDAVIRLLNDVLDLKRVEAELEKKVVPVANVSDACREALKSVATVAQAANVTLGIPCENDAPVFAEGDTSLLMRVIVNLLDNAIRFTPTGGSVDVSIKHDGGSQITVIVQDNGVGLSSDARETLFQRFGHADYPVNGSRGSGLGLSISMSAIEAMHGHLSLIAREDGLGTRAIILLNTNGKLTQEMTIAT